MPASAPEGSAFGSAADATLLSSRNTSTPMPTPMLMPLWVAATFSWKTMRRSIDGLASHAASVHPAEVVTDNLLVFASATGYIRPRALTGPATCSLPELAPRDCLGQWISRDLIRQSRCSRSRRSRQEACCRGSQTVGPSACRSVQCSWVATVRRHCFTVVLMTAAARTAAEAARKISDLRCHHRRTAPRRSRQPCTPLGAASAVKAR